jgi:hypothetical protein
VPDGVEQQLQFVAAANEPEIPAKSGIPAHRVTALQAYPSFCAHYPFKSVTHCSGLRATRIVLIVRERDNAVTLTPPGERCARSL